MKKLISIITPCYNEEINVDKLYRQIKSVMSNLQNYNYEHIFIDNCSEDNTVEVIKEIANKDKNIKLISNSRNFGPIRSSFHGLTQGTGDVHILMSSDLQDPPWLIKNLIEKWEQGYKIVKAVKSKSADSPFMFSIRQMFYSFFNKLSDVKITENFYGIGLYDKQMIDIFRKQNDPYPFFRGLVAEIGFEQGVVEYVHRARKNGRSKHSLFSLFDLAIFGIISYSRLPLRVATLAGFIMSIISLFVSVLYIVLKFAFWDFFPIGSAPTIIALFFFSSVQLFFIGLLGEYIGVIYIKLQNRPLVVEKERINFDQ